MFAYFDTSVVLKFYVEENGSFEAMRLRDKFQCASSVLLPVELRGALFRWMRCGRISRPMHRAAERRVAEDRVLWDLGRVDATVLMHAETVVTSCLLKGADAVHIATAMTMQGAYGNHFMFITADTRQATVAAAVGLPVRFVGGN